MAEALREGDQPLPVPNDGESMHDRAIARMQERKEIGLRRYDSLLQIGNGRDFLRDLSDELADALAYAEGLRAIVEKIKALPEEKGQVAGYYLDAINDVLGLFGQPEIEPQY